MRRRFREQLARHSGPEASRSRPRSVPERPESVPGASRRPPGSVPGASREVPGRPESVPERLWSVPGPSWRRPESSKIAPKAPRTDLLTILARFWLARGDLGTLPERFFIDLVRPSVCVRRFCDRLTERNEVGHNDTKTHARSCFQVLGASRAPFARSFDRGSPPHVDTGIFLTLAVVLSDRPLSFHLSLALNKYHLV